MPRYVILYHQQSSAEADLTHWDLMLETAGALRTWQIHQYPVPNQQLAATPLPDHRLDYLQYEGPVTGNRGQVSQWDGGNYEGTVPTKRELFSVRLKGGAFCGTLTLQPHPKHQGSWQVQFPELVTDPDQPLEDNQEP
jgi:hypothetical protein